MKRNAPALIEQIPHIPKLAWDALQEMRKLSENQQKLLHQVEERHVGQLRRDRVITLLGLIGLGFGVGWGLNPDLLPDWQDVPTGAWISGGLGGLLLLTRLRGRQND